MSTGINAPRWQRAIEEALEEDKKAIHVYQLATIESASTLGGTSPGPAPQVRAITHRAILSPRAAAHPILLTTTDVRTPKAAQVAQNGRVELAWWFPKSKAQIRISGITYIYPSPNFELSDAESVPEEMKRQIEDAVAKLRSTFPAKELGGQDFDWEKERRARFDATIGHLRASWVRPVPGSLLSSPSEAEKWPKTLPKIEEAGDPETKAHVEMALKNFALVVIDPLEVDYVELGVIPNRRTRFSKAGEEWKEEALVP